jgi:hypothetical protein
MNENKAPIIDITVVFKRLSCLDHIVSADMVVDEWHQASFEERPSIEMRFSQFTVPLLDGTLPASPFERRLANTYIEFWSLADRHNASWCGESAVVLEWVLQLREQMPSFDQTTEIALNRLSAPTPLAQAQARAELRSRVEVEAMGAVAEQWWLRASQAKPAYTKLKKQTSLLSKKNQRQLRSALGSDASLFAKPYECLRYFEAVQAFSIALERVKAMRWLLNGGQWDDAEPDTSAV